MNQLPAFLQSYQKRNLVERSAFGGTILPPHISIGGNRFALVDGSGERQEWTQLFMDIYIIDVSGICKSFYEYDWEPGAKDPPTCWSSNGVGPSMEAVNPQAPTCAVCKNNERGSKISRTGAQVKACRDEYYLAVAVPSVPGLLFRLVVTPGSFKNWEAYRAKFKGQQYEYDAVITRISFQPNVNGQLLFEPQSYATDDLWAIGQQAIASKQVDMLCGRNDVPRQAALAVRADLVERQVAGIVQQVQQPAPFVPAQPAALQSTLTVPAQTQTVPLAPAASPSEPTRRRRRTRAEIEADEAAKRGGQSAGFTPGQAPSLQTGGPGAIGEVRAPFRPAEPAANGPAPAGAAPLFGMAQGAPPNAELQQTLDSLFPKQ